MSCRECENEQALGLGTYVRVGIADVYVSGCDEHLRQMFNQLRKGGEQDEHDKRIKKVNEQRKHYFPSL